MDMLLKQERLDYYERVVDRTVEDSFTVDVVVPDTLEDVGEALLADGDFCLWRLDMNTGSAEAEGEWKGIVCFRADGSEKLLHFPVSAGVRLRMLDDHITPELRPYAQFRVSDVTVQLMNSRKLRLRLRVSMSVQAYAMSALEITTGVKKNPESLFTKTTETICTMVTDVAEQVFTAGDRSELRAAPLEGELLACHSEILADVPKRSGARVILNGKVHTTILYQAEGQPIPITEVIETGFAQLLDLENAGDQDQLYCQTQLTAAEVTVRDSGAIDTEFHIVVQTKCMHEQRISCISDAYSVQNPVHLETAALELTHGKPTDSIRFTAESEATLDRSQTLIWSASRVRTFKLTEHQASGSADIIALFLDTEGHWTSKRFEIRLEQTIPPDTRLLDARVLQISASPDLHLRVSAELEVLTVSNSSVQQIVTMKQTDDATCKNADRSSLVLLPREEDPDLWEIAKTYGSSIDLIRSVNAVPDGETASAYLLIPRVVC